VQRVFCFAFCRCRYYYCAFIVVFILFCVCLTARSCHAEDGAYAHGKGQLGKLRCSHNITRPQSPAAGLLYGNLHGCTGLVHPGRTALAAIPPKGPLLTAAARRVPRGAPVPASPQAAQPALTPSNHPDSLARTGAAAAGTSGGTDAHRGFLFNPNLMGFTVFNVWVTNTRTQSALLQPWEDLAHKDQHRGWLCSHRLALLCLSFAIQARAARA